MSMEVPVPGRIPAIVGEVGNARQLPNRKAGRQVRKEPLSSPGQPQAPDLLESAADTVQINADDSEGASLATGNGLTLSDVKAAYDSN